MDYLVVYFQAFPANAVLKETYMIPSWYCKPAILCSIASYFDRTRGHCLFVSCLKYGCRQFTPELSKSFPVSKIFRDGAEPDVIIPEFDDRILDKD